MQRDDLSTAVIIPKFSQEFSENDCRGRSPDPGINPVRRSINTIVFGEESDHATPDHQVTPFRLGSDRHARVAERERLRRSLLRPGLSRQQRSFLLAANAAGFGIGSFSLRAKKRRSQERHFCKNVRISRGS